MAVGLRRLADVPRLVSRRRPWRLYRPSTHVRERTVALGGTVALGALACGFGLACTMAANAFGTSAALVVLLAPAAAVALAAVIANPRLGLLAILATFPLWNQLDRFGVGPLQPTEAAVFLLAALVVVRRLASGRSLLPWSSPLWLALALLAWSSISLLTALDPSLALKQLGLLVGGILLACTVIAVCESMDDIRQVLGGFVIVGTAVALVGVFSEGSLQTYYGGTLVSGRSVGTFQQSNQFGSFMLLAAVTAVGLALGARSRVARLTAAIATSVLLAGVLLSLSRGAWIATIGAFVLLLVALPHAGRLAMVLVPCLMAAAILIAAGASSALQVVQVRADALTARSPFDHRAVTWEEAAREIAERPVFGEGPGNFRVASLSSASMAAPLHDEHAHNIWLEWAAGTGIAGAAILMAFVVATAAAVRRASRAARSTRDRTVIVVGGAALLTVVIHGMFDYTLTHDVIWLSVWFLIGTGLAAHRIVTGAEDNVESCSSDLPVADPL